MCTDCKSLKGKALDVYAAALQLPAKDRMAFVQAQDRHNVQGFVSLLSPMLAEHAHD